MSTVPTYYNDAHQYPHYCPYLYCLLQHGKNPVACGDEILSTVTKMEDWLANNVCRDGDFNYQWSNGNLRTEILNKNGNLIKFSNNIRFRYEEDLLAFTIRFGLYV